MPEKLHNAYNIAKGSTQQRYKLGTQRCEMAGRVPVSSWCGVLTSRMLSSKNTEISQDNVVATAAAQVLRRYDQRKIPDSGYLDIRPISDNVSHHRLVASPSICCEKRCPQTHTHGSTLLAADVRIASARGRSWPRWSGQWCACARATMIAAPAPRYCKLKGRSTSRHKQACCPDLCRCSAMHMHRIVP